jgi:hypothetical protein
MSSDRGASADVADDTAGLFGLDVASSVATGTTSRLVTVTNNVGQIINVTVTLGGTTGTLSNNQGRLQPGESLVVSIDIACGSEADTVSVTVDGTAGDRFKGNAARSTSIDASGCKRADSAVAYVDDITEDLRTVAEDGTVSIYNTTQTKAIGQPNTDLDGDGDRDVPYVDANDNLRFIDASNNSLTLDSSGNVGNAPLGVGDYDGTGRPEIYYIKNGNLLKAEDGSGTVTVVNRNFDVTAVAGVTDFDGDGALEVVFTGKNNRLIYLDDTGSLVGASGTPTRVDAGRAISTPADYDGDGQIEVAAYDGGDEGINLYDAAGEDGSFDPSYQVVATPMGALDTDGNGVPEIIHLGNNQNTLRTLDATDGSTAILRDAGGTSLQGNGNTGVK